MVFGDCCGPQRGHDPHVGNTVLDSSLMYTEQTQAVNWKEPTVRPSYNQVIGLEQKEINT